MMIWKKTNRKERGIRETMRNKRILPGEKIPERKKDCREKKLQFQDQKKQKEENN